MSIIHAISNQRPIIYENVVAEERLSTLFRNFNTIRAEKEQK